MYEVPVVPVVGPLITGFVGGVDGAATVTARGVEVARFPLASRATASRVCEPVAVVLAFQTIAYGAVVSSALRFRLSSLNCTPTTLTLSEAVAETATDAPETVAPARGVVMDAVGGVVSVPTMHAGNEYVAVPDRVPSVQVLV